MGSRTPVIVEKRDGAAIVTHGFAGGILAGLVLGAAAIVVTVGFGDSGWMPFRFVTAFAVGNGAFSSQLSLTAAVLLGVSIHLGLSAVFGIVFFALLALTYQQSARAWLLIVYGAAFGFMVFEVNFVAVVKIFFPYLEGQLDLHTLLINGVATYALVYGPALGLYAAVVRPGVVGEWRETHAPADTFGEVGVPGGRRRSREEG